jgi:NAD(P)-dependent dehydrogenase (short-subunit alcohol dehydrogenase family)
MSVAGKTIVITGATSGMGEAAVLELARQGARMVLIARDKARGDVTMAKLKSANPGANHTIHYADLSRTAEMKRVGAEVAAAEPKIDVLINNAGAVYLSRKVSADGLEMTFAINHLAYFVVTNLLLDRLKATPGARVVSTSSDAHNVGKIDFDDLQLEKSYSSFRAYGTSKLENILFTRELAKRLSGTGVTANCLHPGFVGTRFGQNNANNIFMKGLARLIMSFGLKPEDGAKTIVYLAASDDVAGTTGEYFYNCKIEKTTDAAKSDADAKRLWDVSAKIAGL